MSGRIPRNGLYDDAAGTIVGWQGRIRRWRFDRAWRVSGLTDGDQGRPRRIGAGSPFPNSSGSGGRLRGREVCSMMVAKDGAGSARKLVAASGEPREAGPARPPRREGDAPAAPPGPDLWFPDVPRMELEEVIDQLTARAQDVLAAQGRLRQLLRANAGIVGDLSLPVVLRQIVTSARDLVQARFAALGVVRDGVLEEFIHTGMDADQVERIGQLPQGEGILGLLIDHPEPVRLDDLTRHRQTVGFPDGHPPMQSFLGVPIRVRDRVFGNLYLTESVNGSFSVDDEQLVTALAATAGVAIANARLFEETEQQRRWLSASSELTQQPLRGRRRVAARAGTPVCGARSAGRLGRVRPV